jgi:cardiolipin synthase
VGGVNISDWMSEWRDTVVKIEGDIVQNISHAFELVWKRTLTRHYHRVKKMPVYDKHFEVLINAPRFRQRFIYHAYIASIRSAKHSISLSTPYFVPDVRFMRVLRMAVHRGVEVKIILPTISDSYFVDFLRSWYISRALKAGIRVFGYKDTFYHAKAAVIDDTWATVGSFNLDSLSFIFNHEINVASSETGFISSVKSHFVEDLTHCKEITQEVWNKRSRLRKVLEILTWPFHDLF